MSVALNNGAAIVAFIGLSGQTLRGILFLYDFIENVNDAPDDLRCLYVQLKLFQLSFATFRQSIAEASSLRILTRLDDQTRLALEDAEETVREFQSMMEKHGEGRATSVRRRIKVAVRKSQLVKISHRLERVSAQISSTHANIALMSQFQHQVRCAQAMDLDDELDDLAATITSNSTEVMNERFELVNRVTEDVTRSILSLIGEMSFKIDRLPVTLSGTAADDTRRQVRMSPSLAGNPPTQSLAVSTKDSPGTTIHLSAAIRRAINEVLPQVFFNAGGTQATPQQIEMVLPEVLQEHDEDLLRSRPDEPGPNTRKFTAYPATKSDMHRHILPYARRILSQIIFNLQEFVSRVSRLTLRAIG